MLEVEVAPTYMYDCCKCDNDLRGKKDNYGFIRDGKR
jgi:hypothetical protein